MSRKPAGMYRGYKWHERKCPKCGKMSAVTYGRKNILRTRCCLADVPAEQEKKDE